MKTKILEIPILILASGPSRRMGTDKASLELAGKPLIGHVADRLALQSSRVLINSASEYDFLSYPYVTDQFQNVGPLGGLEAGLSYIQAHFPTVRGLVSASCDAPFVPANLVSCLIVEDGNPSACRIACSKGRLHWTHAFWPVDRLEQLRLFLKNENRAVGEFARNIGFEEVEFEQVQLASGKMLDPFFNVNTPEQLEWAEKVAQEIAKK